MHTRLPFPLFIIPPVLLVLAAPRAAAAQQAPPPVPAIHESIVVTATGRETPESSVGASVTVVDRGDIDARHALSAIDLLRAVPGVVASRPGGIGNLTALWVRGGESTYNKVLLDGMPLNEPGGAFNFAAVAPENIERIEVLRGAHTALFGSDAMASVIQIFSTRPDTARPQVDLTVDGGTYATGHVAAGAGARAGSLEYRGFVSRLSTDNREPNNAHDATTLSASVGVRPRPGAGLRLLARGDLGRTGVPGQTAFGRPDLDAYSKHGNTDVLAAWDQTAGERVLLRAAYSFARTRQESVNLVADPPYTPQFGDLRAPFAFSDFLYDSSSILHRHHVDYRADIGLSPTQTLTAALAYDGERAVLADRLSGGEAQRPRRDNTGATIQYERLAGRLSVVGGLRLEHNGSFGFYAAPRASASWLAAGGNGRAGATRVHASAGLGIKEPTFLQSYSPNPFFLGNPDLDPERSRGYDAGLEQRLFDGRLSLDATWFANRFDDLISLRQIDPATFSSQYFNIGETRANGLELTSEARIRGGLEVRGYYALLDSKVVRSTSSSPIFAPGRALYRRPRHSGSIEAALVRGRISLSAGALLVGARVDTDSSSLGLTSNDGYATVHAGADLRVARRASAFVAIENLAGASYMEPLGYPALGRAIRAGVRARF